MKISCHISIYEVSHPAMLLSGTEMHSQTFHKSIFFGHPVLGNVWVWSQTLSSPQLLQEVSLDCNKQYYYLLAAPSLHLDS
eukprot:scaffold25543_cov55-Attheya_sp.AAC.1